MQERGALGDVFRSMPVVTSQMDRSEGDKRKLIRKLLSGAIPEVSLSLIASIAGCKVQEVRALRREMRDSGELPECKEDVESGTI